MKESIMDFQSLKKNFEQFREQIEAARKEMAAKSTGFIEAACKQFFDICPEVESVFWTQFTPYFNDGEACEFSVHELHFTLVGDEECDDYEGSYLYTVDHLARAQKNVDDAVSYAADPKGWAENFRKRYRKLYGREYYMRNPRPVYSLESAQEQLDRVSAFLTKYSEQDVERINEAYANLSRELSLVDEDIMRTVYGDRVKVTITRTGTEIDEYDHS